jgi:hypothetical protein
VGEPPQQINEPNVLPQARQVCNSNPGVGAARHLDEQA